MKDVSGQNFKYAGKNYTFVAILYSNDGKYKVVLDNKAMRCFEFESELNSLVHRGSIQYADEYGKVDKLLEQQGAYCEITFVQNDEKFDGQLVIEKFSDENRLYQKFLIENIGILDRNGSSVSYRIELISSNIYKCIKNIQYTNYGSRPVQVFDILKACLSKAELQLDDDTFDKVKTAVRLNYVTNGNDNAFTITDYLLNKLYYYPSADDSLKYIFYNETDDKLQLCDIKNKDTLTGSYTVILSLMKSKRENLVNEEQNKLASVTRFPTSDNMKSMFSHHVYEYDYGSNRIGLNAIDSKTLANYVNRTYDTETLIKPKQKPVTDSMYVKKCSYWNNDIDLYGQSARMLAKNNALLVETSGEILRKPAALVNICIDRDTSEVTEESKETLEDMMSRYRGLEGAWIASRVHHYVYPQQGKYRQALTLVRNYTVDLENKNQEQSSKPVSNARQEDKSESPAVGSGSSSKSLLQKLAQQDRKTLA